MGHTPIHVAIDARLASTDHTGDSAYWRGLLHGLGQCPTSDLKVVLYSNSDRPRGVPETLDWCRIEARSGRWWSLVAFPLRARRAGARVLHTQYNLSPLAGSGGVTTVHDVSFMIGPEWFRPRDRTLLTLGVRSSIRRAARVLTVSETSRGEIERFFPASKGKVVVTPNALRPDFQGRDPAAARLRVADRFGLSGQFLLTAATQWPRKNLALAIEATRRLPDSIPHRLVLVGKSGWGTLPEHPRVMRTGWVDDLTLEDLYAAADLVLVPSHHEGFGIPVLEAWASRTPVMVSPGGALPEVAGEAALLAPDFEPETWARLIVEALANPGRLEGLRTMGTQRLGLYSWITTAERTQEAYRAAAASL